MTTAPAAVVTGTGRSGTAYTAAVLSACGLSAGHEAWFNPTGVRTPGLDVDVSWLAVPSIEAGHWSGPVMLVTRHPVACVRALVGAWFLTADDSPYTAFALSQEPGLAGLPPVERAVEWWARWNRRAAAVSDLTVQVEQLRDSATLAAAADVLGHPLDPAAAATVATNVHHGRRVPIPADQIWRLLDGRAARFGYEPSPEE